MITFFLYVLGRREGGKGDSNRVNGHKEKVQKFGVQMIPWTN